MKSLIIGISLLISGHIFACPTKPLNVVVDGKVYELFPAEKRDGNSIEVLDYVTIKGSTEDDFSPGRTPNTAKVTFEGLEVITLESAVKRNVIIFKVLITDGKVYKTVIVSYPYGYRSINTAPGTDIDIEDLVDNQLYKLSC